jgi:hypothetical protein
VSQRDSEPKQPPLPSGDRVIAIGRATLRNVDFRKARFDRFALDRCLYLSCDFRGVTLDRRWQALFSADPINTFRDCHFDEADMRKVRPDRSRFERCTFHDTRMDGWRAEAAEFVDCRFSGALGAVTFFGSPAGNAGHGLGRARNEFHGNDFAGTHLAGVTFTRGIDLHRQTFALDDTVIRLDQFAQRVAHVRTEVIRWQAQADRIAALDLLKSLTLRYRDQTDVIAPRLDSDARPVYIRVWSMLEKAR